MLLFFMPNLSAFDRDIAFQKSWKIARRCKKT